jgi:hypothetical protein
VNICPLAFTPLYDPLTALYPGLSDQWLWLLLPLVVIISVVYKCTRIADLRKLPRDAAVMSAQIVVVMAFAAVLLYFGYYAYVKYAAPLVP